MKAESSTPTLEMVETKFADWRRTREKRTAPLLLKQQTVGLLLTYSQSQVLKRLKISHAMLKRWHREVSVLDEPQRGFVSLPSAGGESENEERSRLMVTRRRVDGEALSLEGELTERQWNWVLGLLSERVW